MKGERVMRFANFKTEQERIEVRVCLSKASTRGSSDDG